VKARFTSDAKVQIRQIRAFSLRQWGREIADSLFTYVRLKRLR